MAISLMRDLWYKQRLYIRFKFYKARYSFIRGRKFHARHWCLVTGYIP